MKKLIILSIFALSFSSVSPTFAADFPTPVDVEISEISQETMPQVLPVAENVRPAPEAVGNSNDIVIVPAVLPSSSCVNLCPTPLPTPPNPLPEPIKNINPIEDIIIVEIPCLNTCPNPSPSPVIIPGGEVITPCSDVILSTSVSTAPTSEDDRVIIPTNPCPSITPIAEVVPTGNGGGSVFYPTAVLPVNAPVAVEVTTQVPVQQVLGEQKVVMEKIPVPSFPKTGAGPSAPSTPTNAVNAIMNFSFSFDRKRAFSIA